MTCFHSGSLTHLPPSPAAAISASTSGQAQRLALGAKYMCLTAQHEGGFALWNSSYTNSLNFFDHLVSSAIVLI